MTISSPLDIGWDHAYWVEGPAFQALYPQTVPAAGGLVLGPLSLNVGSTPSDFAFDTWPDEVGSDDAVGPFSDATWDASNPDWNDKPVAVFNHGTKFDSSGWSSSISQPLEQVVIVAIADDGPDNGRIFVALDQAMIKESGGGDRWEIWAGNYVSTGTILDHGPHVLDAVFDSTDTLDVDGSTEASGNAGTNGLTLTQIGQGSGGTTYSTMHIAFYGIASGTLSSGDRADLVAWAATYYSL